MCVNVQEDGAAYDEAEGTSETVWQYSFVNIFFIKIYKKRIANEAGTYW
jgi:hypothetical protein